ncbi:MAG: hypothetical protein LBE81_09000 [Azonexus sp.]|nr:hypothetical protein [Azonexus sp.]
MKGRVMDENLPATDIPDWMTPYLHKDTLTLHEASCLWAVMPLNLTYKVQKERYAEQSAAMEGWVSLIQAASERGEIEYVRPIAPPQQPRQAPRQANDGLGSPEWRRECFTGGGQARFTPPPVLRFTLAALRAYAESIGERPLFLFPEHVAATDRAIVEKPKAPAPTENTLLATIAALLAAWPGGKQPTGKDLERAAQSVGVNISDDAIRNAMKQARDISPNFPAPK